MTSDAPPSGLRPLPRRGSASARHARPTLGYGGGLPRLRGGPMSPENPQKAVEETVEKIVDTAKDAIQSGAPTVPGAPGSDPPSLEEPTEPREPLPPKAEHGTPRTVTPT